MYHCKCFLVTFKKHLQWYMRWYMRFILHDSIWTLLDTWHVTYDTRHTRVIRMLHQSHLHVKGEIFFLGTLPTHTFSLLTHSFSVHSLLTPYSLTPYSLTHSLLTHCLLSLTHHTCKCARARARKKHRCRAVQKSKPATLIKDSLVTPVVITKLNLN